MIHPRAITGLGTPRFVRKAVAVFCLMAYLFAGVLHGVCDADVTNPKGGVVFSLLKKDADTSGKSVAADHHCHGCFHVSMPAPVIVAIADESATREERADVAQRRSMARIIDPPPRTI